MRYTLPLPADILLDIFQFSLVDHSWQRFDLSSKPQPNPLQTAIVLASVCTHWRIIMLQSSATWSKLLDVSHLNNSNELFNLVAFRMLRSAAPIWLRFHDLTPESIVSSDANLLVPPGENQMRFVDMILARLHHRVCRLDLDIWNPWQFTQILAASLPGIWTRATHIHLGTKTFEEPEDDAAFEVDEDEMYEDEMLVDDVVEDADANEDQDSDGADDDTDDNVGEGDEDEDIEALRVLVDDMRYRTELSFRQFLRTAIQAGWRACNLTSLRLNGISPSAYEIVHLLQLTPKLELFSIHPAQYWHARDSELLQQSFDAKMPLEVVHMPNLRHLDIVGYANFAMIASVLPRLKLSDTHVCEIKIDGALGFGVGPIMRARADFAAFGPALRAIFRRALILTNCFEGAGDVELQVMKVNLIWCAALKIRDRSDPFHLMVQASTSDDGTDREDYSFPNWLTDAIFSPILTEAGMHKDLKLNITSI